MRVISAAVLALTLSASQVLAADATAPLAAGKPAGAKAAQFENIPWTAFLAVAFVGIGIGFAASQQGHQGVLPVTTSTSP